MKPKRSPRKKPVPDGQYEHMHAPMPTASGYWWVTSTEAPGWREVVDVDLESGIYWRSAYENSFGFRDRTDYRWSGPVLEPPSPHEKLYTFEEYLETFAPDLKKKYGAKKSPLSEWIERIKSR